MARAVMSNSDVYSASVYGQPHPSTLNFIQNMVAAPTQALSDIGRSFMSQATEMYDRYHGEDAMRRASLALRRSEARWDSNTIRPLETVEDLQFAPTSMHRYLMACPDIRTMYHKMQVDGYSEQYEDLFPEHVGESHYDYRRVMDGIVTVDDQGNSVYTEYLEDLIEGDRELMFAEQSSVLRSWDHLMNAIWEDDEDPTSRYGDSL